MEKDLANLFQNYNQSFEKLKKKLQNKLPRSLRLFNIRLRLAIDIQIDFKGEISLTKTKEVRETYVLLIRLMESWNAYEALFHYVKETKKYSSAGVGIYKAYPHALLSEVGSLPVLKMTLDTLKSRYLKETNFKTDFKQLIKRIENDIRIKPNLIESCKNIVEYFEGNKIISGAEIIAIIYAERNMYYHNGETAKMGMDYKNRQYLLKTLTSSFYRHMLLLITYILDKEYEES